MDPAAWTPVAEIGGLAYPLGMVNDAKTVRSTGQNLPATSGGRRDWVEFALILAIFFIVGGAPAPHVNESHYLTKATHYWDPSYCPGDFFLDSADPHLTFYWTFGWLTRLASLTEVAWIGRVAAWALLAYAWLRLARTVSTTPWTAVLSAAIWVTLLEKANFAGEWVVGGIEAKCFAYGFVLLGLAEVARGRWRMPWVWFGVASAFHVLVGAWAVLAALGVWLAERRDRRTPLVAMLPSLILGGILSMPGLLPGLALERGTDPAVANEAARIYVFERLPHHLAPLSLPAGELQMRLVRFGLMAAAFVVLWVWAARREQLADTSSPDETPPQWQALLRTMRFAGFALAANVVGLTIEAALADDPLAAARVLRYYWFRQADIAVPLAVALAGTQLVVALLSHEKRLATAAVLVPLIACGWFLATTSMKRIRDPKPPALARMVRYQDWQDACAWVRNNTPADARFLIPRAGHSFKWYASRADAGSYKDVPQDAASVVEWRRRGRELFPLIEGVDGEEKMLGSPDQWGTERARALAKEYGASHILGRTYPPLDLPIVYPRGDEGPDSYYTVYETGESPAAPSP